MSNRQKRSVKVRDMLYDHEVDSNLSSGTSSSLYYFGTLKNCFIDWLIVNAARNSTRIALVSFLDYFVHVTCCRWLIARHQEIDIRQLLGRGCRQGASTLTSPRQPADERSDWPHWTGATDRPSRPSIYDQIAVCVVYGIQASTWNWRRSETKSSPLNASSKAASER